MANSLIDQVRKNVDNRRREVRGYFLDMVKSNPDDQIRLAIFAQGRTGSTLLESLIASTGHFQANGELLNAKQRGRVFFPLPYIRGLTKRRTQHNFLFHVKIYHLTAHPTYAIEPSRFLRELRDDGWKFIYLRRENKVRHALSNVVAVERGKFHKFDDQVEKFAITIDCEQFIKRVNDRYQNEDEEREALKGIEYHEVIYERDLEKATMHQSTIDQVTDFLSLERRDATTEHRKITTQPIDELIVNYDEFTDCMRRQGWQNFF